MLWAGCARGVVSVSSSPGARGVCTLAFSRVCFGLAGLRVVHFSSFQRAPRKPRDITHLRARSRAGHYHLACIGAGSVAWAKSPASWLAGFAASNLRGLTVRSSGTAAGWLQYYQTHRGAAAP